jgi:hypothetical protein
MLSRAKRALRALSMRSACAVSLVLAARGTLRAQAPAVELSEKTLLAIQADYESGRTVIYCFGGRSNYAPQPVVHVDSAWVVPAVVQCPGVGVGFISRIADREFMISSLRGLIDGNSAFQVVSAFYSGAVADSTGQPRYQMRTLSIVRGGVTAVGAARL